MAVNKAENAVAVRDVELRKTETGISLELGETRLFQPDVIVIVQIVNSDNPLAAIKQRPGDMKADEAGGARKKNRHPRSDDERPFFGGRVHPSPSPGGRPPVSFWRCGSNIFLRRRGPV
jgi:hypothetical protein